MDVWYNGKYGVSFYAYGTDLDPIPDGSFLGHTWNTWGLVPEARPFFPPPQRKRSELDSNGINGKIDISKSLIGIPLYENREASWKFYVTDFLDRTTNIQDSDDANILDNVNDPIQAAILQTFSEKYTQLLTMLNGREVAIVLDEDPNYFYKGFVDVDTWESPNDDNLNGITLRCDVFPYKIKKEITRTQLTLSEEMEFDSGEMPLIPYLEFNITHPSGRIFNVQYSNEELGLSLAPPISSANLDTTSAGIMTIPLLASYRYSRPSFLCSNYNLHNKCKIKVSSFGSSYVASVYLLYREGCM